MKPNKVIALLSIAFCCVAFCWHNENVVSFSYPNNWPKPYYNFEENPLNKDKITLGRALFYDTQLSKNNAVSCASCHSPYNAFAHTDHELSHGINDQIGTRNAPSLMNLAWHKTFMWDGAVNHIDVQALAPISNPLEMDENISNVVNKLQKTELYPKLFLKAFNDSVITGQHVLKAFAQFQLSLLSNNSKYDQVKNGTANFTEQEQKGYQLFQQHCNNCHTEPLFSTFEYANNGLAVDTSLNDIGLMKTTLNSNDSLKFKIPTLRNLSYSYPYMHDGRFQTISEVLTHYTSSITQHKTIDKKLKTPIHLTSNEKVDLTAFLLTLNDSSFVFNPDYQFPRKILLSNEGLKK